MITEEPTLVTYCDLHAMVALADRFEFNRALEIAEAIFIDRRFEFLPTVMRERIFSSIGQYQSMCGQHRDAADSFKSALDLFSAAIYDEKTRNDDRDQTMTYRAINSFDAKLTSAQTELEQALGGSLEDAANSLATDDAALKPYHHHLLLRSLALSTIAESTLDQGAVSAARTRYLANGAVWICRPQHPWPLIELYRGLLLWQQGVKGDAINRFHSGIRIAASGPHGATLKLIAAMIASVAHGLSGGLSFKKSVAENLDQLGDGMPAMKPAARVIRDVRPGVVLPAILALPFNYH